MSIVCCNCGKKIDKFHAVKFTIEYLEEYLASYFDRDIKDLRFRNIQNKKWVKFRSICFNIIEQFGKYTPYYIGRRYGISDDAVRSSMSAVNKRDHDYLFIKKDLIGELPESLISKYS